MEEWRKGWHPERMQPKGASDSVLVVGAGPAGLEAARALGLRGYTVALAEAGTEPGGRVTRESRLPGLAAWARVRDYRLGQILNMPNVEVYYDSRLTADDVMEFGFENVAIATGAIWRRDGVARHHLRPITVDEAMPVFTPDDLMAGAMPQEGSRVVLYDDDHYYIGGVLAELLVSHGCAVALVTPSAHVSDWTNNTLEQARIQRRLIELGVEIHVTRAVTALAGDHVTTECTYSGRPLDLAADTVVLVTARTGNDELWRDLAAREPDWQPAGIKSVRLIGDAQSPAPIAWATYAGHRYARAVPKGDCGVGGGPIM
jgi:dimethylamine/trimethylamine dehydrogenase